MRFGEALKKIRLEQGFGLRNFADKVNIDASFLSNIEKGRKNPPSDQSFLDQIFEALPDILIKDKTILEISHKLNNVVSQKNKIGFPIFATKNDGTPLSEKEMRALSDYIQKESYGEE